MLIYSDSLLVGIGLFLLMSMLFFFFLSRRTIYKRRKFMIPSFCVTTIFLIAFIILFLKKFGFETSDSLSVASLALSFLFGVFGSDFLRRRKAATIAMVVPSKAPFNKEVRKGLSEGIGMPINSGGRKEWRGEFIEIIDPFDSSIQPYEDITAFSLKIKEVVANKPDFVVVNAPSLPELNSSSCENAFKSMIRYGARIICLEIAPDNFEEYRGRITKIVSDMAQGARTISDYAASFVKSDNHALIIAGAEYSHEANTRFHITKKIFTEKNCAFESRVAKSWKRQECFNILREYLKTEPVPDVIICGNDTMALGAVEAIDECRICLANEPKVFGYDGIPEALLSIAQKRSPFFATIRTPPSAFGKIAADIIISEMAGERKPSVHNQVEKINISTNNLVTKNHSRQILEAL